MKQEKKRPLVLHGVIALLLSALLLAADQVIKYYVLLLIKGNEPVTVIGGLLEFTYLENTGAAFGLFKEHIWLLMIVAFAAFFLIVALLFFYQKHTFFSYSAAVLLIAGGIGNMIDRFLYGFVVDFIHVLFFDYVFNFADCCITVGTVLFVIHVLLVSYREKKETRETGEPSGGEES